MKKFIVTFILLFFPMATFAAIAPYESFCERQGYDYDFNKELGKGYCIFDNGEKCLAYDFYNESCGQEYLRELPCVKEGEYVFSNEKCCVGEPYLPSGVLGQPKCKSLNLSEKIDQQIGSFGLIGTFIVFIFVITVVIIFVVVKKRRK